MPQEAEIAPHPRIFRLLWLPLARAFATLCLFLLGGIRTLGNYRVPNNGGVLILSNHISDLDPIVVQWACRRPIHFMAKSELFEMKLIGPLLRFFRAFPVKRGEPDRGAIKLSIALLQKGEAVAVFPEGQLSEDGELQELKPGVALIVRIADCQVICCSVKGTSRMMPYGHTRPSPAFHTAEVLWGEPRRFDKSTAAEEILRWAEGQFRELGAT